MKLLLNNKEKVNVEMQLSRHKGFLNRMLYYWASLYREGFKKGQKYTELQKTYSLVFTDFKLFPQIEDFINSFSVLSTGSLHFPLTDHLSITVVELAKFPFGIKDFFEFQENWP